MRLVTGASRFLIGLVTCFYIQRLRVLPVDPVANAAQAREVVQVMRRGGSGGHREIVIVPRDTPHKFVNSGDSPLRQIAIHVSPRFVTEWL